MDDRQWLAHYHLAELNSTAPCGEAGRAEARSAEARGLACERSEPGEAYALFDIWAVRYMHDAALRMVVRTLQGRLAAGDMKWNIDVGNALVGL